MLISMVVVWWIFCTNLKCALLMAGKIKLTMIILAHLQVVPVEMHVFHISSIDYIIVPQNTLSHFKNFNVKSCMSIVEDHNLFSLLNERSRIPDHAVLLVDLSTNIQSVSYETSDNSGTPVINRSIKYNCKIIPEEFLNNEKAKQYAHSILDQINVNNGNQEDFDFIYDNICSFINNEMYTYLRPLCS